MTDEISRILFTHDPIGISSGQNTFEDNTNEYDAEAETIVIRLPATHIESVERVAEIAHKEFVPRFDDDMAGPRDRYVYIAQEILEGG